MNLCLTNFLSSISLYFGGALATWPADIAVDPVPQAWELQVAAEAVYYWEVHVYKDIQQVKVHQL